jgi:2-polyprenyl-6-methoxyphenol hydroxylase-like FAD-dependent oxidoreductase
MRCMIAGGGIGGLTTAIALARRGVQAEVYEAAPELKPLGAGIWVPPNAMQVFDRLGLAEEIRGAGQPITAIEIQNAKGRVLQRVDIDQVERRFGHGIVSIRRSRLHESLAERLDPRTIHFGRRCTGYVDHGDRIALQFDDGSTAEADLVIGADGVHSAVRRQMRPDIRIRYAGQTCFLGLATLRLADVERRMCRETWGAGIRFGYSAVAEDIVYWFAPVNSSRRRRDDPASAIEKLKSKLRDFPPPVVDIVSATPAPAVIQIDIQDIAPVNPLGRGRVVLIGDAAHAMTPNLGQGGAQAVEDAYTFAECIGQYAEPSLAIREYQKRRWRKVSRIVRTSRWYGRISHVENPVLRRVRDAVIQSIPPAVNDSALRAMYEVDFA